MRQVKASSQRDFDSVRGLIVQLAAMPEIDNETKVLVDFGSGRSTPVYKGDDWWIVYRLDREGNEDVFSVLSIWDAKNPPHTRL